MKLNKNNIEALVILILGLLLINYIKQNKMYNKNKANKTSIKKNTSYVGETIEQKVNRIVNNKEPIKDGAPIIFTERIKGVEAQYDIRTDRWEVAIDAMNYVNRSHLAKRDNNIEERGWTKDESGKYIKKEDKTNENDSGADSKQATGEK